MEGKLGVIVCLSCYNKLSQTRWLINSRNLLLKVLEPGSLKPGSQHGLVRVLFWVADFFLYPHVAERARDSLWTLFDKALIPYMRASPT